MQNVLSRIKQQYILLIYIVSLIATIGSLYLSEVEGFEPCVLCWYQRILMYPIVIISLIALLTRDKIKPVYFVVLSLSGAIFALYHYIGQKTGGATQVVDSCGVETSCVSEYINWFGFVTIPFLSLTAFTFIFIISAIALSKFYKRSQ